MNDKCKVDYYLGKAFKATFYAAGIGIVISTSGDGFASTTGKIGILLVLSPLYLLGLIIAVGVTGAFMDMVESITGSAKLATIAGCIFFIVFVICAIFGLSGSGSDRDEYVKGFGHH